MKTLLRSTVLTLALCGGVAVPAFAQPMPHSVPGADDQTPWAQTLPRTPYGVVTRIEAVRVPASARNPGAGALLGGAIGAVIGRQVGGGSNGRAAGTLVGAVVGAIAGHHLEKSRGADAVRVSVRLDDGRTVAFDEGEGTDLRVGERVRIEHNRVVRVVEGHGHYRRGDGRHDDRNDGGYGDRLRYDRSADLQSPLV